MMPEINGFDILRELREKNILKDVPTIVLTSSHDSATKLKALELGATDFLSKPVDQSELPRSEAVSGVKVTATYLGGTSIGRFQCWLELKTNLEKSPKLSILVAGSIVGDVSIFGPGWAPRLGLLRMGSVRR